MTDAIVTLANTAMTCLTFAYMVGCVYRYSLAKLDKVGRSLCERRGEEPVRLDRLD